MQGSILHVEMNNEEILKRILTNSIKMITERGFLKVENLNNNIDKILKIQSDDFTYKMPLDKPLNKFDELIIKYIPQQVTTINKSAGSITDFLSSYKTSYKLVIVKGINTKSRQHIQSNYSDSEVFLVSELMINLVDHDLIPKVEILSVQDRDAFCQKHMCKKRNIPKMSAADPLSRYYNLKPNDIIRVIRPSETSGFVPSYRLIIHQNFFK